MKLAAIYSFMATAITHTHVCLEYVHTCWLVNAGAIHTIFGNLWLL